MNRMMKILIMCATTITFGYIAGQVTQTSVDTWYPTLQKPFFTPPNIAFPIAWGILYAAMGVAAGLVWGRIEVQEAEVRRGLTFFWVQFVLNMLWSYLFFGLMNPLVALVEIVLLWLMIYETLFIFRKVYKAAGYIMMVYLAWVTYATALNAGIWWMNR